MCFAGATNIVSDDVLVSQWIEKAVNEYGAWLTFENWLIFINRLSLGLVGGEPIKDYNNLNLIKIGGWLANYKDWYTEETRIAMGKYETEKQQDKRIEDDAKRAIKKQWKALYDANPDNATIPIEIKAQIIEDERIMREIHDDIEAKVAALPKDNSIGALFREWKKDKEYQKVKQKELELQATKNQQNGI